MKRIHQKRLAKLALALLENRKNINLRMLTHLIVDDYDVCKPQALPSKHECGTSCCFVGYAPTVFPATRKLKCWGDVEEWVTGYRNFENHLWDNLFSPWWPDDAVAAVARALYALEHPEEAKDGQWYSHPAKYRSFGPAKLKQRLSAFL